jgi:hypothetical protein
MENPFRRKKDREVRVAGGNVGLNVGFAPFFMVTTAMQLAVHERTTSAIKTVMEHTTVYTSYHSGPREPVSLLSQPFRHNNPAC